SEVERLFSDLGQTQTPHQNGMTVDHMEKYGKIRARLKYELHERQTAISGTSRRQHNHMHTRPTGGIDGDLAKDLENPITWIPPLREDDTEQLNDEDIVEKAFQDLQKTHCIQALPRRMLRPRRLGSARWTQGRQSLPSRAYLARNS
ncbi:hypothetical protein B0H14DRAFT_2368380, partial [Mycena olivaceomarginata]